MNNKMNNELLTFETLMQMLKKGKIVLNSEMYDYLEGVINLDYSVVKELITNEQRDALNDLQLYRSALIYNIQMIDREYYNNEYIKDNVLFFGFCIGESDIPTITLYNRTASLSAMSDSEINKKITMTQLYLERIKSEYGLTDDELDIKKPLVKRMPGLAIYQNITKY